MDEELREAQRDCIAKFFEVRLAVSTTSVSQQRTWKVIREECRNYRKENIFNVEETGIQYKVMPQRTGRSCKEDRKTVRRTKDMHYVQGSPVCVHVHQRRRTALPRWR